MKRFGLFVFLIFSLLIPSRGLPREGGDDLIQKLQMELDSISDWQADFTQRAYLSSIGQYDDSSGTVKIKKPGRIYWEYLKPDRQALVSDGKKLYFYVEEDKQVMVSRIDSNTTVANLLFLAGKGKMEELFHVELDSVKDISRGVVNFRLTPKTVQPNLSRLILTVDKVSFGILSIRSLDPYENSAFVEFSNVRKNPGLSDDIFSFTVPEGVEVINASEMME